MTIKFQIKSRWDSRKVLFEAEIECEANASEGVKLGLAVRAAYKSGANLSGANLRDAYLSGANLSCVDLSGANLSCVDLSGAYLRGVDLSGADLRDADLRGANLRDAYLRGADLSDADLRDAYLSGANLSGADLRGANLRGETLRPFKADLWLTLTQFRAEVPGIIAALREGRVNGSTYSGECACLIGTVSNVRGCDVSLLDKNDSRPAERWFLMIKEGDKPSTDSAGGFASKTALEWCLEYAALTGIDVPEIKATGEGTS